MTDNTTYDESVRDFDLDFLNQNSNGTSIANTADQAKFEKQKRNISIMKKKIISSDSLITQFYAKKQMYFDSEKNLAASKEECKQLSLEYRNALERCSELETEVQTIQAAYKSLEDRFGHLENQCAAYQSHIHQMEQLIKEKDSALEALRAEKKKIPVREFDKKAMLTWEKEKALMNRDNKLLTDLVKKIIGKRRLKGKYIGILRKYELPSDGNASDTSDVFEEPFSPPFSHLPKKPSNVATDSECDYSVDTGRGSSIASDNDKFIFSPEYFIPTPLVTTENRSKSTVVDIATSPIIFEDTPEQPSLPLLEDHDELVDTKNVSCSIESQLITVEISPVEHKSVETQKIECNDAFTMTEVRTLPLITIDRSISPMNISRSEIATSPMKIIENIQKETTQEIHEKECLELNNSNNVRRDNRADFEIETILNTMRFSHDVITPIPRSPRSRPRYSESRNMPSRLTPVNPVSHVSSLPSIFEGGFLDTVNEYSRVEELKMELDSIKKVLKQHILLTSKPLQFNHKPLLNKLVTDNDNLNEVECMDSNKNTSENLLDYSESQEDSHLEISQSGLVPSPIDTDSLFGTSQVSSDRDLHNMIDDDNARTPFPTIHYESNLQNLGEAEITTETNLPTHAIEMCQEVNDTSNEKVAEDDKEPGLEQKVVKVKRTKRKRLSKLDKIKKNLKPKYKISANTTTLIKSQLKSTPHNLPDKKIGDSETSASLNDKAVYERAVKVMAELNSKQDSKTRKVCSSSFTQSVKDSLSTNASSSNNLLKDNSEIGNLTLPKTPLESKTSQQLSIQQKPSSKAKKSLFSNDTQTGDNVEDSEILEPLTKSVNDALPTSASCPKKSLKDISEIGNSTLPKISSESKAQRISIKRKLSKAKISLFSNDSETSDSDGDIEIPQSVTESVKNSLPTSATSPKKLLKDNSGFGNRTLPTTSSESKLQELSIKRKSSIGKISLFSNETQSGDKLRDSVIQQSLTESVKDSLPTSAASPKKPLKDNSGNGSRTLPKTSSESTSLATTALSSKHESSSNAKTSLFSDDTQTKANVDDSEVLQPLQSVTESNKDSLPASPSSPQKILRDSTEIGNRTLSKTNSESTLHQLPKKRKSTNAKISLFSNDTETSDSDGDSEVPRSLTESVKGTSSSGLTSPKTPLKDNDGIGNRTLPKTNSESKLQELSHKRKSSNAKISLFSNDTQTSDNVGDSEIPQSLTESVKDSLPIIASSPKTPLKDNSGIGNRILPKTNSESKLQELSNKRKTSNAIISLIPNVTQTVDNGKDSEIPQSLTESVEDSLPTSTPCSKKPLKDNRGIGNRILPKISSESKTQQISNKLKTSHAKISLPTNVTQTVDNDEDSEIPQSLTESVEDSLPTSTSSSKKPLKDNRGIGNRILQKISSESKTQQISNKRKSSNAIISLFSNDTQTTDNVSDSEIKQSLTESVKDTSSIGPTTPKKPLKCYSGIGNRTSPKTSLDAKSQQLSNKQKSSNAKISLLSDDTQTGNNVKDSDILQSPTIATRSKSRACYVVLTKTPDIPTTLETIKTEQMPDKQKIKVECEIPSQQVSRKRKNNSSNEPEIQCKRILRSSTAHQRLSTENKEQANATPKNKPVPVPSPTKVKINYDDLIKPQKSINHDVVISYEDLDLFSDDVKSDNFKCQDKRPLKSDDFHPKQSILCSMIDKYGVKNVKNITKKIPDATVKMVYDKIEQHISHIIESSPLESKPLMNKFVGELQKFNHKHFLAGLMKYLTKPDRKLELFSKVGAAGTPPMTKAEQILLYVILNLKGNWPFIDIVDAVLTNIEYTLFKLNKTPEFGVIESASHFYAILCRFFKAKSRLRLFILDAMYCIQFKSTRLIKQCLDVWMHAIPLAHMQIAKCPLVTCLVYLLHFYKCTDRQNSIQELRQILKERYFYEFNDWNDTKILDMFKHSILELKEVPLERKMLRMALIILAKRQGPKWCHNQIIKNLLLPMIERPNISDSVKEFCVSMLGPLMKPYPADMKVNCEIVVNKLTDMLNKKPSHAMEEAIIGSMIFINRHDQKSINRILLSRKMKLLSSDLEEILREYVRSMPLRVWERHLLHLVHTRKVN
ncbi:unnamed protein product [Chrysodeixis includens]|uniref:Uncharacterized protein n=1 Tax=Chrysodeixis includens TaxID=689277 RepID=A0A9P0FV68_CHRIL|nr:unnamed protein product [Chrysodeixis includens]